MNKLAEKKTKKKKNWKDSKSNKKFDDVIMWMVKHVARRRKKIRND